RHALGGRGLLHLGEEQPRFLRPHRVAAVEWGFLAGQVRRVEVDRRGGFGGVQVGVVKVRLCQRRRSGADGTEERRDGAEHGGPLSPSTPPRSHTSMYV